MMIASDSPADAYACLLRRGRRRFSRVRSAPADARPMICQPVAGCLRDAAAAFAQFGDMRCARVRILSPAVPIRDDKDV